MRLYRSQINKISSEIIRILRSSNDIEVIDSHVVEAEKDVASVLDQYLKTEQRINDEARDLIASKPALSEEIGRIKRQLAERYHHITGEEGVRWLSLQIIECMLMSQYVDEVFSDDQLMRRKIIEIFKHNLVDEGVLDNEVRNRIKNLQEGTSAWSIQYNKVMQEVRRKHGLS